MLRTTGNTFEKCVVCPKCHSMMTVSGSISKLCHHIAYPNHPRQTRRTSCNTLLLITENWASLQPLRSIHGTHALLDLLWHQYSMYSRFTTSFILIRNTIYGELLTFYYTVNLMFTANISGNCRFWMGLLAVFCHSFFVKNGVFSCSGVCTAYCSVDTTRWSQSSRQRSKYHVLLHVMLPGFKQWENAQDQVKEEDEAIRNAESVKSFPVSRAMIHYRLILL